MRSMLKSSHGLSKWLSWVAMGLLIVLMLLPIVNIAMRLFPLTKPLKGTFELVGFFSGMVASFSLAYCAVQKGHIEVELVFSLLPERVQLLIHIITSFLSTGVCFLIVWQSLKYALDMWRAGETSMDLYIPLGTIVAGVACGFVVLGLVYLSELLEAMARAVRK